MAKLDEEIDRLFQLPLTEFTAARNALAKDAGKDGAGIKALAKPPVAAWSVNQLYWKNRDVYDALIDTAVQMRKAHKSVMEGKNADLRVAGKMHEEAVEAAVRATVALMKASGQPVTDTTRHAILNTLRALPGEEPPGRLTQTLAPGGFEMLAGINIQGPPGVARRSASGPSGSARGPSGSAKGPARSATEEREAARAREQKLALERAVREADQKARHAEFEAARAAREAGKAEKTLEEAQRAYEAAREAMKDAERNAKAAVQGKESADRRVREAQSALDAARAKLDST
jgi:hypothetical protein